MESRRSFRSSVRSRESSSTSDADPREKIIDCCRKIIAFMCTQVGVGGLVVGYTMIGAAGFMHIEKDRDDTEYLQVIQWRNACVEELWDIVATQNIFNETDFRKTVNKTLKRYQENIVHSIKKGYDGRTPGEIWSYSAALMFSLSIITMVGYGNMVPRTPWGKGVTVIYAVFGIPLYVLYFMNMGEVLAGVFRWGYTWLYECSTERGVNEPPKRIIVPSTACLWVIGAYVLTGAIMFAEWEKWNYLDSTYFCVTSLCKIGFGDLVPGANISDSRSGSQTKLVINFIYMLVGLGLVAMCYNLMREEVQVKVQELKEDIYQCLEDTRLRLMTCCSKSRCRKRNRNI
ncbi:potassium channel subfamily K member 2 [Agrilus planipennis]|uniref:Potassium channel subfamily K member 2 n=1 Tax=Agrilus planipennis TaxID=224129 RepID=A0A7F5R246_AGRPL|nr:potassium channel subfamily K member 2 [Agrilus planipennis]XP_025829024.1 potassium channel subfamily K member 2 [Agrilus planipennis]